MHCGQIAARLQRHSFLVHGNVLKVHIVTALLAWRQKSTSRALHRCMPASPSLQQIQVNISIADCVISFADLSAIFTIQARCFRQLHSPRAAYSISASTTKRQRVCGVLSPATCELAVMPVARVALQWSDVASALQRWWEKSASCCRLGREAVPRLDGLNSRLIWISSRIPVGHIVLYMAGD